MGKKSNVSGVWVVVLVVGIVAIWLMWKTLSVSAPTPVPVAVLESVPVPSVMETYQDPAASPLISPQDVSLSSWDVVEYRSSMVRMSTFVIPEAHHNIPVGDKDQDPETQNKELLFPTVLPIVQKNEVVDVIPRIVHICWKNTWVSSRIYDEILFQNLERSKGFDHRFYTNSTIMKFLRTNFPPLVLETYLLINPEYGACMSDFFRYCVLYVYGGVYLDIKSQIMAPLSELWKKQFVQSKPRDILCLSYWPDSIKHKIQAVELEHRHGEIMNWVLVCSKGHPVMKLIIDKMVANIQLWHKYKYLYGEKINVLRLTGPIFLTRTILQELRDPQIAGSKETIFIDEVLNNYFRYSSVSTSSQITFDLKVYQDSGVTHYSQFTDPIVLFGTEGPPIISFFADGKENETPLQSSFKDTILQSTSSYVFKPVYFQDPKETDAILKSVFQSLEFSVDKTTQSMTKFKSWELKSQQDFLRYAVLYDRGGYFIESSLSLSSDPMWDLYIKQVDCVMSVFCQRDFEVNSTTRISPLLMKFPSHHDLLKKSLLHMLDTSTVNLSSQQDHFAVLSDILQQQHNPNSRLLSIQHGDQNQSLLVSSVRFVHKSWIELPETVQDPPKQNQVVVQFAGFPIGFIKV